LSTGTPIDHLKQAGTTDSARERLNIVVNIGTSWLAQVFSIHPDMPYGPATFLGFTLIRALLTFCSVTESVLVPSNGTHSLRLRWHFDYDLVLVSQGGFFLVNECVTYVCFGLSVYYFGLL